MSEFGSLAGLSNRSRPLIRLVTSNGLKAEGGDGPSEIRALCREVRKNPKGRGSSKRKPAWNVLADRLIGLKDAEVLQAADAVMVALATVMESQKTPTLGGLSQRAAQRAYELSDITIRFAPAATMRTLGTVLSTLDRLRSAYPKDAQQAGGAFKGLFAKACLHANQWADREPAAARELRARVVDMLPNRKANRLSVVPRKKLVGPVAHLPGDIIQFSRQRNISRSVTTPG
jgi:hypothetical protein